MFFAGGSNLVENLSVPRISSCPVLFSHRPDHPAGKEESSTEKIRLKSLTSPSEKGHKEKPSWRAESSSSSVTLIMVDKKVPL